MTPFEFDLSLFGLLLGFTLLEVLKGFAALLRARRRIRIGLLTPLLAVFVMLDVLSFWQSVWDVRNLIPANYAVFLIGLIITGLYYLAASLIFPDEYAGAVDCDHHYFTHHRTVLSIIWFCGLAVSVLLAWKLGSLPNTITAYFIAVYWLLIGVAIVSKNRKVGIAALSALILVYLASAGVIDRLLDSHPARDGIHPARTQHVGVESPAK